MQMLNVLRSNSLEQGAPRVLTLCDKMTQADQDLLLIIRSRILKLEANF